MKYMLAALNLILAVVMLAYALYAAGSKNSKEKETVGIDMLIGVLYLANTAYILFS